MEWVKHAWKDPGVGIRKIRILKDGAPKTKKKGNKIDQLKLFGPDIGVIVTDGEKC